MKYLITGLGNIGSEYLGTRHNIGFRVVNALVEDAGVPFTEERYSAIARMRIKNCELIILKPNTFMNLSGNAVRYWLQKRKHSGREPVSRSGRSGTPLRDTPPETERQRCRTQRIEKHATVGRHTRIQPSLFRYRQGFPLWGTDQRCAWQVPTGRAPGNAGKDKTGGRNHQKLLPGRRTEYNEPIQ